MVACNASLVEIGDEAVRTEVPLFRDVTFHHLGLALTAIFSLFATIIACTLIFLHAVHYSVPHQQKHIIRILFMLPVYAVISFVSYKYFRHAIYWEVLRDCYEAFAIASFFTLMCAYLEPDLHEQKERFRQLAGRGAGIKNWVWPLTWMQKCTGGKDRGIFRIPRSGLTWFNIIYVGVYQYCFIRVVFTFVAMITQFMNRYCESSLSPAFSHVWVMTFEAASVTVAMYCLIQFYVQLKDDLAEHKPFMKILCIKLVIFFSFWQAIVISFLSSSSSPGGALIKPTAQIAYPDIKVGIPSLLLAIEMTIFAIIHIFAFSWKPYDITKNSNPSMRYQGGRFGWKALWDAFNLWDIVKAAARGFRWLFHGSRYREGDASYEANRKATSEQDTSYRGPVPNYDIARDQEMANMRGRDSEPWRDASPMPRTKTNGSDDQQGLLSHAQSVPQSIGGMSYETSSTRLGEYAPHEMDARR